MTEIPETLEELQELSCEVCGAGMVEFRQELAESMTVTDGEVSPEISRLLAYGIDPGPPWTRVKPISYAVTVICENGHDTSLGLRFVERLA